MTFADSNGVPSRRDGLAQGRNGRVHVAGQLDQIALRNSQVFGESALARRHADDLPIGAQVCPARAAGFACPAGDERVQGYTLARETAVLNGSASFVAEDQGWGAALVVAEIGMHVGSADADRFDLNNRFAIGGRRPRLIAKVDLFRSGVNKRFHAAVRYFAE
jgi:hypothetical protein